MGQNTLKIVNDIFYTIRPSATFGACLLVLAAFDPQPGDTTRLILLLICTFFGSAFCFMINDIYDRKKDLLNHKHRPIASGELPLRTAVRITVNFGLLFAISAFFLGPVPFGLSFVFLAITAGYSVINVRSGLLANSIVAFIVSGTQWGVAIIKPDAYLLAASLFLFFFTIPREMLLDWLDKDGDKKFGKSSAPVRYSSRVNLVFIVIFLLLASASLAILILENGPNKASSVLFILTILSAWISFLAFFRKTSNHNALLCVRISHSTFALFILAMLTR